jgi:hypothetical protein
MPICIGLLLLLDYASACLPVSMSNRQSRRNKRADTSEIGSSVTGNQQGIHRFRADAGIALPALFTLCPCKGEDCAELLTSQ